MNCISLFRHQEHSSVNKRRRGNETLELMVKKMEMDAKFRQDELCWKREQEEKKRLEDLERERKHEQIQQQFIQQQHQLQQQLLQQQQQAQQHNQQMQLMMMSFMKYLEKK